MTTSSVQHHDNLARMAALEQRVTGIEQGVNSVANAVAALSDKFDRRSGTNWPVIWSAAGVCTGIVIAIGGLVYKPLDTGLTKLESRVERIADGIVTRSEHERQWREQERFIDGVRDRVGRAEKAQDRLEDQVGRRLDLVERRPPPPR